MKTCVLTLDPALLWLWRRPAAVAPIGPLTWEPLCAAGAAIKRPKKKKKKKPFPKSTAEGLGQGEGADCWKGGAHEPGLES